MIVTLTQENIDTGIKRSPSNCPIAKAMGGPVKDVEVARDFVRIGKVKYKMPFIGKKFQSRFDNGFDVEPVSFEVVEKPVIWCCWPACDILVELPRAYCSAHELEFVRPGR